MEINGIISSLPPELTSAVKQAEVETESKALAAKKAIDVQKETGEAMIKALEAAATQTGKGINIDLIVDLSQ